MFKRIFALLFLLVLIATIFGVYQVYRDYVNRKTERLARLQQKTESISVTLIEGWTNDQVANQLEKQGLFSKQDFLNALNKFDESQYPLLVRPENLDLEGYLFPDTYKFFKASTPDQVIADLLDNFSARLRSAGVTDPDQKYNGLTLAQIITLASIIEKESGGQGSTSGSLSLQEERDLVASVFYNRMRIGQALESDATINFITKKDTPAVSASDLQINSAYNTYKYPGLPPGPICNPSLGSIKAALNPATSDYFYFLHKQPSGAVVFSRTFNEHVKNKTN